MMKSFSNAFCSVLCLAALLLCAAGPVAATAADEPASDSATTEAPVTGLTPEQIQALQENGAVDPAASTDDQNVFEKVSDFITDHAPFFIIGIVVLAAIIAGIFIMRGRSSKPKAGRAAGAPADVPSASEIRRRKRAAMQRSRDEERLRRKAGMESRQAAATTSLPLSARLPEDQAADAAVAPGGALDPVEAEKQSARAQAAGAVARSTGVPPPPPQTTGGAVPAPVAPSQTAPSPGVVTPGSGPDTSYSPATGAFPVDSEAAEGYAAPPEEGPTMVNPQSGDLEEPAIESPGLDARTGEAAAAFVGGAAGGALAARGARGTDDPEAVEHATEAADPEDDAARDAEQRLRAKVAEIRAEQGRPATSASIPAEPEPEPVSEPKAGEPEPEPVPETPSGLTGAEDRLLASGELRDQTLRNAEERLKQIEERAIDAERRAAFAERLAQLKIDESERERRLNDIMSGIDRAEGRALEAEKRAKSAEEAAAAALEEAEVLPADASSIVAPPQSHPEESASPAQTEPAPEPEPDPPAAPAHEAPREPPARSPLFGNGPSSSSGSSGSLNLNSATFEELREADLSVTQATRILAYRERFGGYRSIEDLEKVPGFPPELIESLRSRISI